MNQSQQDRKINKAAFIPAMVGLAIFFAFGLTNMEKMGTVLNKILYWTVDEFGWYLSLLALVSLVLPFGIAFSKYGKIRIGGENAKAEFSYFNWFAMTTCGVIGTGLLFWAMGEPMYHMMTPPVAAGVEPGSREAAIFAVSQAMMNWSLVQYGLYTVLAVGVALLVYNRKKRLSMGSVIEAVFGREVPWLETFIHGFLMFCMVGAMGCSMGAGLLQIGAGLENVFGIEAGPVVWLAIAVIIAFVFILSSLKGIAKGLKFISSICIYLFIAILIYVLIFGNTKEIMNVFADCASLNIQEWPSKTIILSTLCTDTWPADWNGQYYASFFVWAPVYGLFLCRMAKGRTVKEFILVNVLVPTIFCWFWIAVFGGTTVDLQLSGRLDVWAILGEKGMESTVFEILSVFPASKIFIIIFLTSIIFSFCTCADPISAVLATMSVKRLGIDDEAPGKTKMLFGVLVSLMAWLLVASGGIGSIKGMWTLVGLPVSLIVIFGFVATMKTLKSQGKVDETELLEENNVIEEK